MQRFVLFKSRKSNSGAIKISPCHWKNLVTSLTSASSIHFIIVFVILSHIPVTNVRVYSTTKHSLTWL